MRRRCLGLAFVVFGLCVSPRASGQAVESAPSLTLVGVRAVAAAAAEEASANGWNVVIVVVDAAGNLLSLERMDGALPASVEVAQQKARTAALYRRSTKAFADRLATGDAVVHELPEMMPIEGGLPIFVDGRVVGAVGVSGVRADQDAQIAQAGIDALVALLNP